MQEIRARGFYYRHLGSVYSASVIATSKSDGFYTQKGGELSWTRGFFRMFSKRWRWGRDSNPNLL